MPSVARPRPAACGLIAGIPVAAGLLLLAVQPLHAGDWPQILGPGRNGQATNEQPIKPWADGELSPSWVASLGQGYAGVAVAGGRTIAYHRVGKKEAIVAWDAQSGRELWNTDFPARYRGGQNPDTGPRCVPVIAKDRIILFGAGGDLHCIAASDGTHLWSRDTFADFRGQGGYFGAGSTPIVSGQRVLVNVGGRAAGIVAFDLRSGETVWAKTKEGASYSSPTIAELNGRPAIVFVTRYNTLAIDPRDGNVLFQFAFGRRGPTVNAATPLVFGDKLFVSSSYGVGAKLARIGPTSAEIQWSNDDVMSSQYSTCVYRAGFLYGAHGREDQRTGELRCLDAQSGKLRWRASQIGVAHTILVNDQLLVLETDGKLTLATASPNRFLPLVTSMVSKPVTRALPAYANGRLYVRDPDGVRCFVLAP